MEKVILQNAAELYGDTTMKTPLPCYLGDFTLFSPKDKSVSSIFSSFTTSKGVWDVCSDEDKRSVESFLACVVS